MEFPAFFAQSNDMAKVTKGSTYAITQTTDPRIIDQCSPTAQYKRSIEIIQRLYKDIASKLILYPELTKRGQIHFHGHITVKDNIKFYKSLKRIEQRLGRVLLKELLSKPNVLARYKSWDEYIIKDHDLMKEVISYPQPYNIENHSDSLKVEKMMRKFKQKNEDEGRNSLCEDIFTSLKTCSP